MLKNLTLISAIALLAACGGSADAPKGETTAPHKQGEKLRGGGHADGSDHGHRRAHEGRDPEKRAARFKQAAETLGVSEERLKEVLRASRDKPRNWDEIGAELGVDGDAVRAAIGRPNRTRQ